MTTLPAKPSMAPKRTLYELIEEHGYLSLGSMEGVADFAPPRPIIGSKWQIAPGIILAVTVTAIAYLLHKAPFAPFTIEGAAMAHPIGASILAILLGITLASLIKLPKLVGVGCKWVAAWLIPIAIVFLGARMDFTTIANAGVGLVVLMIGLMAGVIFLSLVVGKLLGLSNRASYLLGVGTAVCGSSAILAVAPVSGADDEDVVLSIGAVNLVGLVAMFTCVGLLYIVPDLSAQLYGAWSGASIHAVPQVAAAGDSHGAEGASVAMMVKLLRVSLLAPVVMLSALWIAKKGEVEAAGKPKKFHQYIPWFVWGFVILAMVASLGLLPDLVFSQSVDGTIVETKNILAQASKYLLAVAMAAIGLQVNIRSMFKSGAKVVLAGVVVWLAFTTCAFFAMKMLFA